jgi:hypothetical protein
MSTLKVNKIEPVSGSGVEIVGAIAVGGATTGSNDFIGNQTVTGSIDITGEFLVNGSPISGSGGGSVDTSSLATTGSNTFIGEQTITGSVTISGSNITNRNEVNGQYFGASFGGNVGVFNVSDFTEIGLALDGAEWTTNWSNGPLLYVNNTPGDTYEGVFGFEDKTNYTDGKVTALKPLIASASATFNDDVVVTPIDTLPAGIPGQIAFQGGKMHVYINSQWNEVAFVSSPAPGGQYTLTGPEASSANACSSETTNTFYTDGSSPNPSVFLYQDDQLETPANDGFYASLGASQWFEVSGSAGEITATGPCE